MLKYRRADKRGKTRFRWLKSLHTFSFGDYFDKNHMGFSALRVINDDKISADAGFETHGHRNMEIISIILEGELAHKDNQGNEHNLTVGNIQLMSAGSGIYHSEFNPSEKNMTHFLQIWIEPNELNTPPSYQETTIASIEGLTELVTPDGRNNSLKIKQNAKLMQLRLEPNQHIEFKPEISTNCYIHLIDGEIKVEDQRLRSADGVAITDQQSIQIHNSNSKSAYALIFDLP